LPNFCPTNVIIFGLRASRDGRGLHWVQENIDPFGGMLVHIS
jgi:carboxylesterase type B